MASLITSLQASRPHLHFNATLTVQLSITDMLYLSTLGNRHTQKQSDTNTIQESDVSLENIEILSNENVTALVKDIDICKSSGVADVSSRLLKDGFIALIEQLTFILNLSLKTGGFPDVWKVARVRPIPKTGDLTNVNNIRPISLTALPGKLLERYIHTNLVYFLEENKLLCKNQGGFRKKRSTTQTVYHLVQGFSTFFHPRTPGVYMIHDTYPQAEKNILFANITQHYHYI